MDLLRMVAAASAVLLFAGAQAASAQAQTKTLALEEALQVCARVQSATDRLGCFEELARTAAPAADATSRTASEKGTVSADATAPAAPVTAVRPQVADEEGKARYVVMRADDYEKEKGKVAEPAKPVREPYDAVVLRAWRYSNGEYHIALTNGEIWKSQASDNPRPVKDGEKVQLQPGAIGSWFMQFNTLKRPTIRVKRVE